MILSSCVSSESDATGAATKPRSLLCLCRVLFRQPSGPLSLVLGSFLQLCWSSGAVEGNGHALAFQFQLFMQISQMLSSRLRRLAGLSLRSGQHASELKYANKKNRNLRLNLPIMKRLRGILYQRFLLGSNDGITFPHFMLIGFQLK